MQVKQKTWSDKNLEKEGERASGSSAEQPKQIKLSPCIQRKS